MKVLHITTHLNRGGITSYLFSLATGLKKRGHTVMIASSGGELEKTFIKNGIECISIPLRTKKEISLSVLFSFLALRRRLSREPVDIIHGHTRVAQVLAVFLSRKFKVPLVATCHGFFKPRWNRRIFSCWGDKTIAISNPVKDHLVNDFKLKEKNIYIVHNGVDINKIKGYTPEEVKELKKELFLPIDHFVVGTVARFSTVKGLDYLIKAAPFVLRENKKVVFLLIGYGTEEIRLKQIARDLNIEDKIIFFKPLRDSYEYVPVMDIFVMPSIQEGLGLSIIEAQAHKIPVIASNVGGIPDIIEDNVTGILVQPKDVSDISQAILRLINDKDFCASIKKKAYEKIVRNFSADKMVIETEGVYEEAAHVV